MDFIKRVNLRMGNERVQQVPIRTGAFDVFGHDRKHVMENLPIAMQDAARMQQDASIGQMQLLDALGTAGKTIGCKFRQNLARCRKSTNCALKSYFSVFINRNPLEEYREFLPSINSPASGDLSVLVDRNQCSLCRILETISRKITKKDNRAWAFFNLETRYAQHKVHYFHDASSSCSMSLLGSADRHSQSTAGRSRPDIPENSQSSQVVCTSRRCDPDRTSLPDRLPCFGRFSHLRRCMAGVDQTPVMHPQWSDHQSTMLICDG
jgi:DNA polymerase III alpha subunit